MRSDLPSPSDQTTRKAIEDFQSGRDREGSFQDLFERHYRLVRYHFRRHGISLEEAEDMTQETFLRVYRGLQEFRGEARFVTWLLCIADNVRRRVWSAGPGASSQLGKPVRGTPGPRMGDSEPTETQTSRRDPDPLDDVLGKERLHLVLEELRRMPPQMRQCVALRLFQGLKYREIARVLQISLDAVKVQLGRARQRLRILLEPGNVNGES